MHLRIVALDIRTLMATLNKAIAQGILDAQGTVLGVANAVVLAIEGHGNGLGAVKVLLIGHALRA